jgi:putative membrane protein
MLQALLSFVTYLGTAAALLAAFVWLYEKLTPYREFELLRQNNTAAAITLGGAMLGFTFPMMSSIYFTQSLAEMVLWAVLTGAVQFTVFTVKRGWAKQIEQGQVAPAIFVASGSVAIGLLNAVCISH